MSDINSNPTPDQIPTEGGGLKPDTPPGPTIDEQIAELRSQVNTKEGQVIELEDDIDKLNDQISALGSQQAQQ